MGFAQIPRMGIPIRQIYENKHHLKTLALCHQTSHLHLDDPSVNTGLQRSTLTTGRFPNVPFE